MKFKYSLIIILFIVSKTFSQKNKNTLFTINNEPFYTQEFLTIYKKNLNLVDNSKTSIEDYLKLFIDYKLKVKEAKLLSLDTIQKYKNELKQYKKSLVLPYLKDKEVIKKLIKEVYNRLKKEVNVSHILISLSPNASPKDTLTAYNSLIEARNLIVNGSNFSEIAKKYSKDPTVKENGGNVGYFTTLQMVYPFENVAFKTKVNEISMPFKTKFGYHILKVNDIRNSKGEVEVAHIMFKNDSLFAKKRIDSVYNLLLNNKIDFAALAKKVSEDRASGIKGGKLTKFGAGKMIKSFSKVAFSLTTEGEISKPFKTQFGWHIIKLIKKYPLQSFQKMEAKLTQEVEKDERSNLIGKSVVNKLLKQYKVVVNKPALQQFEMKDWKNNSNKFNQALLVINDKEIYQNKFITYLKTVKNTPISSAFTAFKEKEVLDYYKENIEKLNPEFATTYNEFKEGLLLFDLLEKQVWGKAKDSIGLLNFFNKNKSKKYKSKELKNIKGKVISDYQNYLEQMYSKQLQEKYEVKINKAEKKRIKKLKI
ncbi:MAG: peptidylprolyl isomerase [Lutibacter sp.]|uniref:peptidylprolyl isomerase n=1 Tax=Lutibacter sp. TaxID=1925666 RepID=UPI00385894FF